MDVCLSAIAKRGLSSWSKPNRAWAQLIPNHTLGDESSVVNPRNATSNNIDGSTLRGQNLFHTFQAFKVDVGREVDF